jgi:fatty acid desaturase
MNELSPNDYLSIEERRMLMEKSNVKAIFEILHTWAWIAFAFALVYFFPNILTVIVALFILGGKQLGCAIIMHDASHYALFKSKKANDIVGNWLGGFPIINDVKKYRPYHYKHHTTTGTSDDPDISLTQGYPTSVISMTRKMLRDLLGITGVKAQIAALAMNFGILKYTLAKNIERIRDHETPFTARVIQGLKNISGPLIFQLILFAIFYAIGAPLLYLLWIGALLTTFNFSLRIRSMAEHSMVADRENQLRNTRTTYAGFIEKLLFAPHNVNYHLEHHMLMGVPPYNLPKMHKLIKSKGFYEIGLLEQNYWEILKLAIRRKPIV